MKVKHITPPKPGDRILVVQLRAMGDVILTTPVLHALHQSYPGSFIDILVESLPAEAVRNNPDIDRIVVSPPRGSSLVKYYPLLNYLRSRRYKIAFDFLSTPGSAWLTRQSGAEQRIGWSIKYRRWAYTHYVDRPGSEMYSPLGKAEMLKILGINNIDPMPVVYPDESERLWAEDFLNRNGLGKNDLLIGIAPYCKRSERMWQIDNWIKLLNVISLQSNVRGLLFAGSGERSFLEKLEIIPEFTITWVGASDILQAAALMQRCRGVITGENGLLHIAVGVGIKTYSIFCGKDAPTQWVPPDDRHHKAVDLRGLSDIPDEKLKHIAGAVVEHIVGTDAG